MTFGNTTFSQPNNNPTPSFAQPASSSGLDLQENEGALLMFTPTAYEENIQTAMGAKDAVRTGVVILDGPNAGEELDDVLIFPRVLQSSLRKYIGTGQLVLGRLGKGTAKPGQNAPWVLEHFTDGDSQLAQDFLNKKNNDLPN